MLKESGQLFCRIVLWVRGIRQARMAFVAMRVRRMAESTEMKKLILHISGMVCENSVKQVRRLLETLRGVRTVEVDTLARTTAVEHDEQTCPVDDLVATVNLAGLQVERVDFERSSTEEPERNFVRRPILHGVANDPLEWPNKSLRSMSA